MVNNNFIEKVKSDVVIINTANAGLVKENDLSHNMDLKR